MKKERILGIVRHVLTFAGGILVMSGLIDPSLSVELVGALITIIGGVWSILSKKA